MGYINKIIEYKLKINHLTRDRILCTLFFLAKNNKINCTYTNKRHQTNYPKILIKKKINRIKIKKDYYSFMFKILH